MKPMLLDPLPTQRSAMFPSSGGWVIRSDALSEEAAIVGRMAKLPQFTVPLLQSSTMIVDVGGFPPPPVVSSDYVPRAGPQLLEI